VIPDTIVNPRGERLAFTVTPGEPGRRDIVLLGHGVTSDKDRPWSKAIAAALRMKGIASLRFAFSGNGDSEGRFVDSTVTKEVEDLGAVIGALDSFRVSYVGHSMGGAVGLVRASQDERLHSLVSLAAVTHAAEFVERVFGHLSYGEPMLEKSHCPFGAALDSDLRGLGALADKASSISMPWLIVHGTADETVPLQHSLDLHECAPERSELVELEGVDHSFTGDGMQRMVDVVVPWLCAELGA
jgi:pimeloyl-ACP methyl ester carboxylesterase